MFVLPFFILIIFFLLSAFRPKRASAGAFQFAIPDIVLFPF